MKQLYSHSTMDCWLITTSSPSPFSEQGGGQEGKREGAVARRKNWVKLLFRHFVTIPHGTVRIYRFETAHGYVLTVYLYVRMCVAVIVYYMRLE